MKLYIKNMACESCKIVVKKALNEMKLQPLKIELGEVELKQKIDEDKKKKLNSLIKKAGLELVESKGSILIERIKKCIWDYVHSEDRPSLNLSDHLSHTLKYDYTYLSNLFTEMEGITVTEYLTALKVEYAKELLLFGELNVAGVSRKLHYRYPSHFTMQFRKRTGMSPTSFMESRAKAKKRLAAHEIVDSVKEE